MAPLEPARIPITIHEGVDFWFPMRLGHRPSRRPGNQGGDWYLGKDHDLTGWRAEFTVYPNGDYDAVPVIQLTTENGGIELAVQDGGDFGVYNCLLYISAADTRKETMRRMGLGAYDLDIIDPMGHEQRVAAHTCVLERGT